MAKKQKRQGLDGIFERFIKDAKPVDLKDHESDLADLNLTMGNPLTKGIPWMNYTEEEIHLILKMHFDLLDYDVTWRHRQDPANEEGVDLECKRKSDNRIVLVSVKKNPKKDALAQVLQLSDYKADERVYVYIGSAAQSFRDKRTKFKGKVEFWDEKELESKLNETGTTLRLRIANSKANEAMWSIMRNLISVIKDRSLNSPRAKASPETMQTLWGMKDRSVTAHKCAVMAQLMCEDPAKFGTSSHEQVQRLVVYLLDYIYAYGLVSLMEEFNGMSPELQALLHCVYQKTKIRSNWLGLFQYRLGPVPGNVENIHDEFVKEREEWKGITASVQAMAKKKGTLDFKWTRLDDAAEQFRILNVWAHGLEGTIDDMYTKCIFGSVRA